MKELLKKSLHGTKFGRELLRKVRPKPPAYAGKNDLTSYLGRELRLKTYLEITATETGNYYRDVDRDHFSSVERLVYRAQMSTSGQHRDGLPTDYKVLDDDIAPALDELRAKGREPGIVLVNSFHFYDDSLRDLKEALALIPVGGAMVVHDCQPPEEKYATPEKLKGIWYGVSYAAYLDFVLTEPGFDYCTVDCDAGCGVVTKGRKMTFPKASESAVPPHPKPEKVRLWLERDRADWTATWALFERHGPELLRLMSPEAFFSGINTKPLTPS